MNVARIAIVISARVLIVSVELIASVIVIAQLLNAAKTAVRELKSQVAAAKSTLSYLNRGNQN